jgi:hypothetical protein
MVLQNLGFEDIFTLKIFCPERRYKADERIFEKN